MASTTAEVPKSAFSVRAYTPRDPDGKFPYSAQDLKPMEPGGDGSFYGMPRFVTHIDDNAISVLGKYYDENLPRKGKILDFCSSWVSHYPASIEEAGQAGQLEIIGMGMNKSEMNKNPCLRAWSIQDLNDDPDVHLPEDGSQSPGGPLNASTCVVSVDYLTRPVEVLTSIRRQTAEGGKVHLTISNRCFPNKVVDRWLKIGEEERLDMVGDYLWWSGWREIEILTLVKGTWLKDPLWVVRATHLVISETESR